MVNTRCVPALRSMIPGRLWTPRDPKIVYAVTDNGWMDLFCVSILRDFECKHYPEAGVNSQKLSGDNKDLTEEKQQQDLEEDYQAPRHTVTMSLNGTLEKGAHHQVLDLSEELPPHNHLHHHHQHSNSLASTAPAGTLNSGSGIVVPPPYSSAESGGGEAPLELRGSLDCWACSVLVTAQNLVIAAINACLAGLVFGLILTPAIVMVVFGFLCHSTVRPHGTSAYCSDLLTDGGCVALLVVGFLLVTPLLVLALAAYCRLARHLQLGLCFIPYSRAVYKNLPATQHRGLGGGCCGQQTGNEQGKGKVWV
ncbi:transmembrane protein 88 b isoform X2 [Hoplias malabaricus]|uniref:transmembrane protein 88 b isoform X2 n=1 Tax=Hoplias malabaricus TaxID=27720 RepID=UPI00346220F9